jgi:hypothetical protein
VGAEIDVFSEIEGLEQEDEIFATIIAIAMLGQLCQENAAAWGLMEAKAIKWLQARGVDYEALISTAIVLL